MDKDYFQLYNETKAQLEQANKTIAELSEAIDLKSWELTGKELTRLREALENYASKVSWNWEGDGFMWTGGKWDYRRPPWEDAKAALSHPASAETDINKG